VSLAIDVPVRPASDPYVSFQPSKELATITAIPPIGTRTVLPFPTCNTVLGDSVLCAFGGFGAGALGYIPWTGDISNAFIPAPSTPHTPPRVDHGDRLRAISER
jgi:hypothetical protein